MAGVWTWQLAAVIGALVGAVLTLIALGGRNKDSRRDQERNRQEILRELREIGGVLDPTRHDAPRLAEQGSRPLPEPIRMVQITDDETEKKAA